MLNSVKAPVRSGACFVATCLLPFCVYADQWIAGASEFLAGEICLSKLGASSIREGADHVQNTETWTEIRISVGEAGAPKLYVLDGPPPLESLGAGFHDCAEIAAKSKRVILEAEVNNLQATGFARRPAADRGLGVDLRTLRGELGRVKSDLDRIMGGSLSLAGSKAWISNHTAIVGNANAVRGAIKLEAWHRPIKGAEVRFGAASFPVDLETAEEKNAEFVIDLSGGAVSLWNGTYTSPTLQPKLQSIELAGIEFRALSALSIGGFQVSATNGTLTAGVRNLRVGAQAAAIQAQGTLQLIGPKGTIVSVEGVAKQTPAAVEVLDTTMSGTKLAATGIGSAHGTVDGKVAAEIARWGGQAVNASVRVEASRSDRLTFLTGSQLLPTLQLKVRGTPQRLLVSGTARLEGLSLSSFKAPAFAGNVVIPEFPVVGGQMEIPVSVDTSTPQGTLTIVDAGNQVTLSGQLLKLRLVGVLRLGFSLQDAELLLTQDGMQLNVSAAVAVAPLIGGARTQFVQGDIDFRSKTSISISAQKSTGTVEANAGIVAIVDPLLQVGAGSAGNALQGSLTSEGAVKLDYDLAKQEYLLQVARFLATDIKAVARQGATVSAGDLWFTEPNFSIGRIELLYENGTGTASLERLTFAAQSVSHRNSDPAKPMHTWSMNMPSPFVVGSLSGNLKGSNKGFETYNAVLRGLKFTGTDLRYTSADRTSEFASASANIDISVVSDSELAGSFNMGAGSMSIRSAVRGSAMLESIYFQLSGSKSKPVGAGTIVISNIDVVLRIDHDPVSVWATHCAGDKPKLDIQVKSMTRSVLPIDADGGGFKGTAKLGVTYASVSLPDGKEQACEWQGTQDVDFTVGCLFDSCWVEHWKFDYGGRFALHAASLGILSNGATIDVASEDRKESNKRICMGTFAITSPLVYVPTVSAWLKTPIGGVLGELLKKAQQFVTGLATGLQNTAIAAIGNPVLMVDSLASTVDQKTLCFN